jgi:cytochrome c biogenesis protein CcmG/thiol:disulfide interchange protein DsbE
MNKFLFTLPLLLLIMLSVVLYKGIVNANNSRDEVMVLSSATGEATITNFEKKLDFAALRGQAYLVNFFASWCVVCHEEHHYLHELARKKIVSVYGIAYKDEVRSLSNYLEKYGNPYLKLFIDYKGDFSKQWGVNAVPMTLLVNEKGQVIYHLSGPLSEESYQKILLLTTQTVRK